LDPPIVIGATNAVLAAAASGHPLAPCRRVFRTIPVADPHCSQLAHQRT
jgi:hypothetical protein